MCLILFFFLESKKRQIKALDGLTASYHVYSLLTKNYFNYMAIEELPEGNCEEDVNFFKGRELRIFINTMKPSPAFVQKCIKRYFLREFNANKISSIIHRFEKELDSNLGSLLVERAQLTVQQKYDGDKMAVNNTRLYLECSQLASNVTIKDFDIYMDFIEKQLFLQ